MDRDRADGEVISAGKAKSPEAIVASEEQRRESQQKQEVQ
jgi:hypothetical protein